MRKAKWLIVALISLILIAAVFAFVGSDRDPYAPLRDHIKVDKSEYMSAADSQEAAKTSGSVPPSPPRPRRFRTLVLTSVTEEELLRIVRKIATKRGLNERALLGGFSFEPTTHHDAWMEHIRIVRQSFRGNGASGPDNFEVEEAFDMSFGEELRVRMQNGGSIPDS